MKTPGPDHPITIRPHHGASGSRFNGRTVADSRSRLGAAGGQLPRRALHPARRRRPALFERTTHATHCPYKGDANYFSLKVGDRTAAERRLDLRDPVPGVAAITGHLAFYPDRVDAIEEVPA